MVFNPLRERGLERFAAPQNPVEMLTLGSTPIASSYYLVKVGGDIAVLKGMMKALLAADAADTAAGGAGLLDRAFVAEHPTGFDALVADLDTLSWDAIETLAGLSRADIEAAAQVYATARNVIICYGMGITQHRHGTANVQQLANLLLLRGNIGRPGAGICPLRGHSNVQGDRTVGITEIPSAPFLDAIERVFGFAPPREKGHNAVEAVEAICDGRSKAIICSSAATSPCRHVGPGGGVRRHAQAGSGGPHRHQAEPLAPAARPGVDHPALPRPHRAR